MTTEPIAGDRLAWLEREIVKLTSRLQRLDEQLSGRSLKSDFGKLAAVREERAAVELELEALQEERGGVAAVVADEARERQQHENQIAAARVQYDATSPALVEALRSIHFGRLRLIDLGVEDPGDRVFSVASVAAPSLEIDQRAYQTMRQAETRGRATDADVAAHQQRQNLIDQLHLVGRPWSEAEQLAAAVTDGSMTLESALESAGKANEHEFAM